MPRGRAGIDCGIIAIAFDAEHKGAGLEIGAERAADHAAIVAERVGRAGKAGEGVGGIFGIAPAPAAIDANIDAGPVVDRQHRRNVDRRWARWRRWRQIGSQGRSAKADNDTHANDSANDSTTMFADMLYGISHDCGHINFTARA